LPKVTLQVIPFAIGAHPGLDSNFVILEIAESTVNDVIYVEGAVRNIYLETTAELERYKRIFSRLQSIALDPEGSAAMVTRITAAYEDNQTSRKILHRRQHSKVGEDGSSGTEFSAVSRGRPEG
jgi:hypothetical protein